MSSPHVLFLALGAMPALAGAAAAQSFGVQTFPAGNAPVGIATGDFDHDGKPDVATSSASDTSILLLRGDGAGGLKPPISSPQTVLAISIASGDFNGDGKLDLAEALYFVNAAGLRLGDGAGSFGALTTFPLATASQPSWVIAGDWNGDGLLDLAIANKGTGNVSVLLATPGGGFATAVSYATAPTSVSVASGDLNGDGLPDLVTASFSQASFATLLNKGGGTFFPAVSFFIGTGAQSVTVADLDLDGRQDVAAALFGLNQVGVRLGDGKGSFGLPAGYASGVGPYGIVASDVTGEGRPDLLTANQLAGSVSALPNLGGGLFGTVVTLPTAPSTVAVAVSDVNADGRVDALAVNQGGNSVAVLLNQTGGPSGLTLYGTGTPGCDGLLGMGANGSPKKGNLGFALTATNAPRSALGLGLVTNAIDAAGSDPFGLGILLQVNVMLATEVISYDFLSDENGQAIAPAPIANQAALVGKTYFAQGIWFEEAGRKCSPSSFHLVSSRGLQVKILP